MSSRKDNLKETPHVISYSVSGERSGVKYIDNQCLLIAVYKMEDSLGVSIAFYSLFLLLGLLGDLPTLVLSSLLTPPRGD